jgi:DNA helicase-2/ATP-dependent DNA helicase PcrA
MSDTIPLEEIDITGIDDHPATESVKLHGPPGTGKTTEAGARVARLIDEHDVHIGDVTWVTFRRSLAEDTLGRLADWDVLPESAIAEPTKGDTRFIGTVHAVANRTIGGVGDVATTDDKVEFCQQMGVQFLAPDSKPWETPPGQLLFDTLGWCVNNRVDPYDAAECPHYDDLKREWPGCDVADMHHEWVDYKAEHDLFDFHEMLTEAMRSDSTPPSDVVVVDEYHDAYPLFDELVREWLDDADVAIVAGDPEQVVNSYQGADPQFFEDIGLPKILLDKTYRVRENHWESATNVLSQAVTHEPPGVERVNDGGELREYRSPEFSYSDVENRWRTPRADEDGSPVQIVEDAGPNPDVLFLVRTRRQVSALAAALKQAGVVFATQRRLGGWNTAPKRLALFNALSKLDGVGRDDVLGSSGHGLGKWNTTSSDGDIDIGSLRLTPEEAVRLLDATNATYLSQTRADTDSVTGKIRADDRVLKLTDVANHVEPSFWDTHTNGAASARELNQGSLGSDGIETLERALQRHDGAVTPGDLGVRILTIHASKGAEAEDVAVYDGIPTPVRQGMDQHVRTHDNEWRTWYVALTRASERLHVLRDGFRWLTPFLPREL